MSLVRHAESAQALEQLLTSKASGLVVIDFHAVWCAPCHAISPVVDAFSKSYPQVTFVKVDTDKLQDVAQKYTIKAMPTFLFIKNKAVVETIRGADQEGLRAALVKHAPTGQASTSGSSDSDISLLEFIDRSQVNCLNESSSHTLKSILTGHSRNTSAAYLESDTDEQLLLNIPFNQAVRIKGISIKTEESSHAPKLIKLVVNNPNLGFENVQDAVEPQVAQVIELDEAATSEGKMIP
ncbi:SubName: Full=Related to TRX2-thioredoxin II {ECO:0000313/EMBL:CCA68838.1} [Serendipita indica DSM 11827]|nr:SubName: Full=Related to TRX2-thioredoxin II {ECO:0000313/EMBL:CCA68838.1} [Serendipita indica DSM 11827]